jgi:hypothetical protein
MFCLRLKRKIGRVKMDIVDLLNSDEAQLPKESTSSDFLPDLTKWHDAYITQVGLLSGNDAMTQAVKSRLSVINDVSKNVRDALEFYLKGDRLSAINSFDNSLKLIVSDLTRLESQSGVPDGSTPLYRLRAPRGEFVLNLKRKDLFHIPFSCRRDVSEQRYGVTGLPALYLGGSTYVCWEELGRPAFHSLYVARFRAVTSYPHKVLNLAYRPALIAALANDIFNGKSPSSQSRIDFVISQATIWPLLAACAARSKKRGSAFTPEYIIPQMLTEWVTRNSEIDGIRYFSVQMEEYYPNPNFSSNWVFPVKSQGSGDYCSVLSSSFHLTDPINWTLIAKSTLPSKIPYDFTFDFVLSGNTNIQYMHTEFADVESKLELLQANAI